MTLLIDSRELAGLIKIGDAIEAVRQGFTDLGTTPSYAALRVRMQHEDRRLTVHPGGCSSLGIAGMFIHAERFTFNNNAQQYDRTGRRVYVAYDSETAELKAIIVGSLPLYEFDSFEETFGTETSITSAVGTDLLARQDCKIMALYGTGLQARRHLIAMLAIRPIEEVRVYSRSAKNRKKFIEEMTPHVDILLSAVDEPQEAARGSDLICMATNTNVPALFGDWLEPGQHITSIVNSNKGVKEQAGLARRRREVDDEAVRRADIILVNILEQSIVDEHGDLWEPVEQGIIQWNDVLEMGEILNGRQEGRSSPKQITLFKQNSDQGVGYMALANLVCDVAEKNDIGIKI